MGKYDPGSGPYEIRYGILTHDLIPASFYMADWVSKRGEARFQFYTRLEASIKREGFRNPVQMYEKHNDDRTFPYGGSRVYMAQKLQIPVPCIVSDWVGTFSHWELITDIDQALSKFTDLPTVLEFHPHFGCQFWGCEQVQLEQKWTDYWKELNRKNDLGHMKRRMTEGKYFYRALGEKSNG